jgi:RNA recognition motif-containing protein
MDLYIGNIPSNITEGQLKTFFKGYEKEATFKIKRVKGDYQLFVFGLVSIPSERLARKAIKRLNQKRMEGKLLVVREYVHRVSNNDRRNLDWRNRKWMSRERRQNERRTIRLPRISQYITYAA